MFALLTQAATDPLTDVVELWQMLVAAVTPIIVGIITNAETRDHVKRLIPVVTSFGISLITWASRTDIGAEVLVLVPIAWTAIEVMYRLYSGVVAIFKRRDASINDILLPQAALIK